MQVLDRKILAALTNDSTIRRLFQPSPITNLDDRESVRSIPLCRGIKADIQFMQMPDGSKLRYGHFHPKGTSWAIAIVAPGLGDTIGNNRLFGSILAECGIDTWFLEQRNNGGSARTTRQPHKVHETDFKNHCNAMALFIRTIVAKHFHPGKAVGLLAQSMAANALTPGVARDQFPMDYFIPMAPAYEASSLPIFGVKGAFTEAVVRLANAAQMGLFYAPGGKFTMDGYTVENNPWTACKVAFEALLEEYGPTSEVVAWRPSMRYLKAYYDNNRRIWSNRNSIRVPTQMFVGADDGVVVNSTTQKVSDKIFAPGFSGVRPVRSRHALHGAEVSVVEDMVETIADLAAIVPRRATYHHTLTTGRPVYA